MSISANELKTKGVSIIENNLGQSKELIECELEAALSQTRADVDAGRYVTESFDAHIKRVTNVL